MVLAARETGFPASVVGVPESDTFQVICLILHTPHHMHGEHSRNHPVVLLLSVYVLEFFVFCLVRVTATLEEINITFDSDGLCRTNFRASP